MRANANIKSKRELAERLLAGEIFYTEHGDTVSFKEDAGCSSPYVFFQDGGYTPMDSIWEVYGRLEVEREWFDNIPPEGVLCWVCSVGN